MSLPQAKMYENMVMIVGAEKATVRVRYNDKNNNKL